MQYKYEEYDYLNRCHSLVVLGGTFDPIHMGHLAIAKAANNKLKPQRVLFIPSGQSPHKRDRQITNAEHRYAMTTLAICEHPAFDVSRIEINRPGPSYTIDTARALQAICPAGAKISFLVGNDALMNILSWKDAETLLKDCEFIVVPRPGYESNASTNKSMKDFIHHLTTSYDARIHQLEGPLLDISSTNIRERFKADQPVQGLMPKQVEAYARQHEIYSSEKAMHDYIASPPTDKFILEAAREELNIRLSPKRYTHTMGVVSEAEKLAIHYGQDVEKARIAALLHDCTKEYSTDKKRALCQLWGVQLDVVLETSIDITHSLLSAESAKRDFHVNDPDILQAIRYHTTGHSNMTMLDKIIMLADYTEPSRPNKGLTKKMRDLALTNINHALVLRIKSIIKKETKSNRPIHPWSQDALITL